jgi:hypothetical protein
MRRNRCTSGCSCTSRFTGSLSSLSKDAKMNMETEQLMQEMKAVGIFYAIFTVKG